MRKFIWGLLIGMLLMGLWQEAHGDELFSSDKCTVSSINITHEEDEIQLGYKDGQYIFEKGTFEQLEAAMNDEEWFWNKICSGLYVSKGAELILIYTTIKAQRQISQRFKNNGCPVCGSNERLSWSDSRKNGEEWLEYYCRSFYVCAKCENVYSLGRGEEKDEEDIDTGSNANSSLMYELNKPSR